MKPLKKVIVLEENFTAQFAKHLRANVDMRHTELIEVNQCTGLPYTPDDVSQELSPHI